VQPRATITLAFAAATLLLACGTSPTPTFYSLSASAPMPPTGKAESPVRHVVIASTNVPDSIDRPQIVLLDSSGRVDFVEYQRWSESPRSAIPRTIAAQLSRELGGVDVWPSPAAAPADADVRVMLDVTRFESVLGKSAHIDVLWTVRRGGTERTGRTVATEPAASATYEALVLAHGAALGAVSRDLAQAIRTLPAPPPAPAR